MSDGIESQPRTAFSLGFVAASPDELLCGRPGKVIPLVVWAEHPVHLLETTDATFRGGWFHPTLDFGMWDMFRRQAGDAVVVMAGIALTPVLYAADSETHMPRGAPLRLKTANQQHMLK